MSNYQTLNLLFNNTISFYKDDFAKKFPNVSTGVDKYKSASAQFSDSLKDEKLADIKEDKKLKIDNEAKSYKDLFGSVASVGQSYFSDDDFGKILSILYDKNQQKFILDNEKITKIENYFSGKKN